MYVVYLPARCAWFFEYSWRPSSFALLFFSLCFSSRFASLALLIFALLFSLASLHCCVVHRQNPSRFAIYLPTCAACARRTESLLPAPLSTPHRAPIRTRPNPQVCGSRAPSTRSTELGTYTPSLLPRVCVQMLSEHAAAAACDGRRVRGVRSRERTYTLQVCCVVHM